MKHTQKTSLRQETIQLIRLNFLCLLILTILIGVPNKGLSQSSLNDLPVSLDYYIEMLTKGTDQQGLPASVKQMYLKNAFEGFLKEGRNGNPLAMSYVAYMLENGFHVRTDLANALEWHKAAADRGDAWSALRAAQIMETGPDELKNSGLSVLYFRQSFENARQSYSKTNAEEDKENLMWANFHMGRINFGSNLLPANYSQALSYFQAAADLGHSTSLLFIGDMYKNGMGVERDLCAAYNFYKNASIMGNVDARAELEEMQEGQSCRLFRPNIWSHVPDEFFTYWSSINAN